MEKWISPARIHSAALATCFVWVSLGAEAQTLSQPFIDAGYSIEDLGPIAGLTAPYGGLTIRADQPNTLYIGDRANTALGAIHAVPLSRDAGTGRIMGFAGAAALFAPAPFIDGGLHFAPNGTLLYTRYPSNRIGQVLPNGDSSSVHLAPFGADIFVGSLMMVPWGFPGSGNLILASYLGAMAHRIPYSYDAQGYLVPQQQEATASLWPCNGPEGLAAVPPGSPGFTVPSILACSFNNGRVHVFDADATGLPVAGTGQLMVSGLSGVEGAVIDPVTGDFLFSTFSSEPAVFRVSGFSVPSSMRDGRTMLDEVRVWPNPATSSLSVSLERCAGEVTLELITADGRVVLTTVLEGCTDAVDISSMPAGIYLLKLNREHSFATRLIAIE